MDWETSAAGTLHTRRLADQQLAAIWTYGEYHKLLIGKRDCGDFYTVEDAKTAANLYEAGRWWPQAA